MTGAPLIGVEEWDPTHRPGSTARHWTTDNVGEAAPGVLTPLSVSIWSEYGEANLRHSAFAIGAFSRSEQVQPPDGDGRFVRPYFGRVAMQAEFLAVLGDRMPGASGEEMIEGMFGRAAETIDYRPTMRRYPVIAWRLPHTFLTVPKQIEEVVAENEPWWRDSIARLDRLTLPEAQALMADALRRFDKAERIQTLSVVASISPLFDALRGLVEKTGVGDLATLGGSGGAEMAIIEDLWAASRGRLAVGDFVARHGFHGPLEGEVASYVWREDPGPLAKVIASYGQMDDAEDPGLRERGATERLAQMQAEVLAATPRSQRAGAKVVLRLAARRLPQRGYAKRAFLQAIDVARGAARAIGRQFVARGELGEIDDVFFLTKDELARPLPSGARELVARRRERRELFKTLVLPGSWTGELVPEVRGSTTAPSESVVSGIGVSPGVAEGVVAVVRDASFADVPDGAVLVAPTTDPSWSSIMFVSAALVVDIGGHLSHAAVVARELGIPCVVNTRSGTSVLRSGDRVRVDGASGEVEILSRG